MSDPLQIHNNNDHNNSCIFWQCWTLQRAAPFDQRFFVLALRLCGCGGSSFFCELLAPVDLELDFTEFFFGVSAADFVDGFWGGVSSFFVLEAVLRLDLELKLRA